MLELLLLGSTAAFVLAGASVGLRLLALARRTRQLTDFIVGASLFVLAPVAYPLILATALGDFSLGATRVFAIGSSLAMAAGWAGVFAFTQRVFRPGVEWAKALAGAGIAAFAYLLVASIAFDLRAPDAATVRSLENPVRWFQIPAMCVNAWTATEGFLCWAKARRRLALGLADPLVVNRFLLWGVVGVSSLFSVAPSFLIELAGGDGTGSPVARLSTAVSGLVCAAALQLAFLPPPAYRSWLVARAA
ncbi:MAG TPA: hypothetical protein VFT98_00530 [Myxococcota bacterium]|nr:hypothetical protein [Myxococcota bacterium]